MAQEQVYCPKNKVRIVSAASLFDGHDATINIMRRILQQTGAEVIHLGHNRSVLDIVNCAIQEDAQAVAITSYQGGHIEYFKYMYDLLAEKGAGHIKIFGGGGGTILPSEIEELHAYGIARLFSPDDGRTMGLQGMINYLIEHADFQTPVSFGDNFSEELRKKNPLALSQAISMIERNQITESNGIFTKTDATISDEILTALHSADQESIPVLGITGTGGAGKSSLTDEILRRFLEDFPDKTIAVISVDPSKRKTGGALLGDRIRMNAVSSNAVFMRSFATRAANIALNPNVASSLHVLKAAGFDLIIVETAGIGQSDSEITQIADVSLYVMTPEYGAASQLEKIDMIDYADIIALNKFDKRGALDALRDVRKQFQRSRGAFDQSPDQMPVYGTMASQFNDPGTNSLYRALLDMLARAKNLAWNSTFEISAAMSEKIHIIPPERTRYLAEIVEENKRYDKFVNEQADLARKLWRLKGAMETLD